MLDFYASESDLLTAADTDESAEAPLMSSPASTSDIPSIQTSSKPAPDTVFQSTAVSPEDAVPSPAALSAPLSNAAGSDPASRSKASFQPGGETPSVKLGTAGGSPASIASVSAQFATEEATASAEPTTPGLAPAATALLSAPVSTLKAQTTEAAPATPTPVASTVPLVSSADVSAATSELVPQGEAAPSRNPNSVGDLDASTPLSSTPAAPVVTTVTAPLNKIALENMKQGNPESEWGIDGIGDSNIQGFATDISTNIGGQVDFKIATDSMHYRIDIYRLGYYGGDGARKVDSIEQELTSAVIQPHPLVDYTLGLVDCGNWSVSASWDVPSDAVSGVYIAKLVREDGTDGENIIPFVVRDDSASSNIVFQTSDTTWEAYNPWGGANLYNGNTPLNPNDMVGYMIPNCHCGLGAIGRSYAVSYNRPFITRTDPAFLASGPQDFLFGAEYPAIRWIEENGYDVSYISGVDSARAGTSLLNHDVFLSVGHDEYWSGEQRANVEAARDAGVNLSFWSGNECYWKIRWDTSIDGSGTPYRTMVCYKETWANADIDPSDTSTGTWRDPRFADPGQEPENSLTGTMFSVDSYRLDTITIPYEFSQLRFWRNTDVADTQPGDTASLVQNLLGYEWDSDVDNGFRPDGLVDLSLSTVSVDTYLLDYGSTVGPATATHSLTMYRAESGALVFGAGSVYWSWGLDSNHDNEETPVDPNVQQAMVNMFADMGVQPTTLQASLVLSTATTDDTAPVSSITSPSAGSGFTEGQRVTITGTAADLGGGKVAGVEVSTDGGASWHKATGTATWSYTWLAQASASYTIKSRAVDDSLNLEAPSAGQQVTVTLPSTSSLWTFASTPETATTVDRDPVELGIEFKASTAGSITGIRFYKGPQNIGDHQVDLWTSTGTLLASAISTSADETLNGWQVVTFANPISVSAGTTYVASYHTNGYYSNSVGYLAGPYVNGPLTALANGGVYTYGDAGAFPATVADDGTNYWVDVMFGPTTANIAPVAVADSGFATAQNSALVLSFSALLANDTDANGDALTISGVSGGTNGTVTFNATDKTVTFTPNAGYDGPASFTYTAADSRGGFASAQASLTVHAPGEGLTLFSGPVTPTQGDDPDAVELGMKFSASSAGTITGLRYYKSAQDTGTHTGSLWTSTGTLLASATFTNETASGWQTVAFSSPVSIAAGTTYVAGYHSNGNYFADLSYFTTARSNGPLTALSSSASGGNGVYAYGGSGLFPTHSYQASNYWVDVIYDQTQGNIAPVAVDDGGFATAQNTALVLPFSALLANDTDANGDALTISGVSGGSNGTVSFDSSAKTVTFTPTASYSGPASFTYTVSDGNGGSASAQASLTVNPAGTGLTLFSGSVTPTQGDDPDAVELGMKFTASSAGTITALRYYKSAGDTGTHVGSLWSSTGALLASATFTNETASGWQTATLANPVSIAAGTTYVAGYHSNGNYYADQNYFSTAHSNGPLTAPASSTSGGNGVYAYGGSSLFPSQSYQASNYWVDVVYNQTQGNIAPVAVADSGFTTAQNTALVLPFSTLLANDTDANGDTLTVSQVSGGTNGVASLDAVARTVTFTPTASYNGAANFNYTISDGHSGTSSAAVSLSVTSPTAPSSLFSTDAVPTTLTANDNSPVEVGVKFQADVAGTISSLRFYKAATNTGTHVGSLWTGTGTLLASATFTNETASGWQTVDLPQPVTIQAGATYVAGYHSDGNYSATGNVFGTALTSGHLTAPSDSASGGNGVYSYGAADTLPVSSYNKTNYYVDVVFNPQLAA